MSQRIRNRTAGKRRPQATVFAALGDETRLLIITQLSEGRPYSISQLTAGSRLTRQAITKHLRVLEQAGLVHNMRSGRESLFEFNPEPIEELRTYLTRVSAEWEQALGRLKAFVES
jgi:DNA-binding transcriptional ArsR family regulator